MGLFDGEALGTRVGELVGDVGLLVGEVGVLVGALLFVGDFVGLPVGVSVGLFVVGEPVVG